MGDLPIWSLLLSVVYDADVVTELRAWSDDFVRMLRV
jgi:hypothetical protein